MENIGISIAIFKYKAIINSKSRSIFIWINKEIRFFLFEKKIKLNFFLIFKINCQSLFV